MTYNEIVNYIISNLLPKDNGDYSMEWVWNNCLDLNIEELNKVQKRARVRKIDVEELKSIFVDMVYYKKVKCGYGLPDNAFGYTNPPQSTIVTLSIIDGKLMFKYERAESPCVGSFKKYYYEMKTTRVCFN